MKKAEKKNLFASFKILGILNSYFALCPEDCPISGGEKRFFEVVKRWKKRGLKIEILTTKMGHLTCLKNRIGVSYRVTFSVFDRLGVVGAYFFRTIIGCLAVPKFQKNLVIYSATDILPDIIPSVVAKFFNRNSKMICIIFHLVPHYSERTGPRLRNMVSYYAQVVSFEFIKMFADLVFVDNAILKKELIRDRSFSRFPNDKIVVSSLGIDKEYIDKISPSQGLTYDGFFLGRLHVSKGVFDLIEIWNLVVKENEKAKLAFCGTATEEMMNRLKAKITDYNLEDNISFLGFLKTREKFKSLKLSRIFVFPSHEEGWGLAVCEAMACGLPVVAYDLPVFREVFPKGMVRVKMSDYQAFATMINKLFSDKEKYHRLSCEAVEMASRYSWNDVAKKELASIIKIF